MTLGNAFAELPARPAWHAAYAAFRDVLPQMPEAQAKQETTHAIAFASGEPHSLVLGRCVRGRAMTRVLCFPTLSVLL